MSAGAGGSKADVILLAEQHFSDVCDLQNVGKVGKILASFPKRGLDHRSLLLVSEGRDINVCYKYLNAPSRNLLNEVEPGEKRSDDMLLKMIMMASLAESICHGMNMTTPNGVPLDRRYIESKMNDDGFIDLLRRVSGNRAVGAFNAALDRMDAHDKGGFYTNLTKSYSLIQSEGLTRDSEDTQRFLVGILDRIIAGNGSYSAASPVLNVLHSIRDQNVIRKIEGAIRNDPMLKTIVIIFGLAHYDRLERLIRRSTMLQFNEELSSKDIPLVFGIAGAGEEAPTIKSTPPSESVSLLPSETDPAEAARVAQAVSDRKYCGAAGCVRKIGERVGEYFGSKKTAGRRRRRSFMKGRRRKVTRRRNRRRS